MVRKYKKRTYKPRKRTYKRRYYKRRYYKRRYKPIKKPEIHILENTVSTDFTTSNGRFENITSISADAVSDMDELVYKLSGKPIEGKKVRLKYLYIKGYITLKTGTDNAGDINCKLMVFRWKRNTTNQTLYWGDLVNDTTSFNVNSPSTWTSSNILDMMYKQDWRNDIKINFYKKVKNLYRKYDDANNIIPFKIRIPLYDCVLTCDCYKRSADNMFVASTQPSTNGLYFTFIGTNQSPTQTNEITYKYKLYYTDY